jgi:hypothetical protein
MKVYQLKLKDETRECEDTLGPVIHHWDLAVYAAEVYRKANGGNAAWVDLDHEKWTRGNLTLRVTSYELLTSYTEAEKIFTTLGEGK